MKTTLNDRELFYDGTSLVAPDLVPELFLHGAPPDKVAVTELNEDVELFNQLNDVMLKLGSPDSFTPNLEWQLPPRWATLDLDEHFSQLVVNIGDPRYHERVAQELQQVHQRGLDNLIRAICFVVQTFRDAGQVWGVGRGSSCASLLLFLLGLHQVDPVKYGIPLDEFFHD